MAALTAPAKLQIRANWASVISNRREAFALSKADLDAAITACDNWIDTNAAAYNTALPVAARTNLTAAQKAELLVYVALKRFAG